MKLFRRSYNEISDEEAARNAEPRHGFLGFFVTMWEYLSELFYANLLTVVSLLPACLLYILGRVLFQNVWIIGLMTLLGAAPAGAGLCGMAAVATESLRNRGYAWKETYWKEWKSNLKKGILPGALYLISIGLLSYMLTFAGQMGEVENGTTVYIMMGILVVMLQTLLGYMTPMMTLLELPTRHYLKNSLLFMAACPKATIGMMLISAVLLFGGVVLLLPYTGIYILLLGIAVTELSKVCFVWPRLNEKLRIEQRENEKHAAEEAQRLAEKAQRAEREEA